MLAWCLLPHVFMAHPTKLHIVAGKQQQPRAERAGLTMGLRWHGKIQLLHSSRAFSTNSIDKHQKKKRNSTLSQLKQINLNASHETSKAKTWDEIKSFSVIASVYLRSRRFIRARISDGNFCRFSIKTRPGVKPESTFGNLLKCEILTGNAVPRKLFTIS